MGMDTRPGHAATHYRRLSFFRCRGVGVMWTHNHTHSARWAFAAAAGLFLLGAEAGRESLRRRKQAFEPSAAWGARLGGCFSRNARWYGCYRFWGFGDEGRNGREDEPLGLKMPWADRDNVVLFHPCLVRIGGPELSTRDYRQMTSRRPRSEQIDPWSSHRSILSPT